MKSPTEVPPLSISSIVRLWRMQVPKSTQYIQTYREILGSVHLIKQKHLLDTGKAKLVTIKNDVGFLKTSKHGKIPLFPWTHHINDNLLLST